MSNVDSSLVDSLLQSLSDEKRQTILFKALKDAAAQLLTATRTSLRNRLPNASSEMLSGIKIKSDKAYNEVDVHIMGDYRLKWFEKGTKQRLLRKTGANRGSIKALNFFKDARMMNLDDIMIQSIDKQLKSV